MNMKKLVAGVLACCIMGGVMPSVAGFADNAVITAVAVDYTEETYEQLTYKKYSDHIEISKCDKEATEIVIPAEIESLPVTSIGNYAFQFCEVLTSVTIPDSVASIGYGAFSWCTGLTSVTIPDSVTSIGTEAFSICKSLTSINVSENNQNYLSSDGILFNKDKTELLQYPAGKTDTEYVIPESVASIGGWAFYFCDGLTSVKIPDSVTSIGKYAFSSCHNLTSITIPKGITSIENGEFSYCQSLESIEIPDNITSIGWYAFENCNVLTSVTIPESVTDIGTEAFAYCKSMTSINVSENNENYSSADGVLFNKNKTVLIQYPNGKTDTEYVIPDSVTGIEYSSFLSCKNLKSVKIPDSVTSIGKYAFSSCYNLTSVTIPDSVTSVESWAFNYCSALTSATILNPECKIDDSANTINDTATIYGYENSTAQAYAEKYGRTFEIIGEAPAKEISFGNINGDNAIDSNDATLILAEFSLISTGEGTFTEEMKKFADINKDGKIDSVDASLILSYYSYTSTGGADTLEKFLESAEK